MLCESLECGEELLDVGFLQFLFDLQVSPAEDVSVASYEVDAGFCEVV